MVIERAKRLVEHGKDVMILLDSITRLARAYNLTVPPSGRTLSGGLDPAALHMPKRILVRREICVKAEALRFWQQHLWIREARWMMLFYEEFKGTGNMELVLDRKFRRREYSLRSIFRNPEQEEKICC